MKWVKRLTVEKLNQKLVWTWARTREREKEVDWILYIQFVGSRRRASATVCLWETRKMYAYFKWMIRNKATPLGRQLGKQMVSFVWNTKYPFFQAHTGQCWPVQVDGRDTGLIPELGRSLGGGCGNPLQYSCLEYPMDEGAWQAAVHR